MLARRQVIQGAAAVSFAGLPLAAILANPRLARATAAGLEEQTLTLKSGKKVRAFLDLPAKTPAPRSRRSSNTQEPCGSDLKMLLALRRSCGRGGAAESGIATLGDDATPGVARRPSVPRTTCDSIQVLPLGFR